MRVLVYKRTHNGDPNKYGWFGIEDCMGSVRSRDFDAVIGVGGIGAAAQSSGIARKVNWIGIGPHKFPARSSRAPVVTFDHFLDFGQDGPEFEVLAPMLAGRMYQQGIRHLLEGIRDDEMVEVLKILKMASRAPPSRTWPKRSRKKRVCRTRPRGTKCD